MFMHYGVRSTHWARTYLPVILFGLATFLSPGCEQTPTGPEEPPGQQLFTIGTKSQIGSVSVSSAGGILTVSGTETLSGLTIRIPNGSYSESRTFTVSSATITAKNLAKDLSVLGPMITVQNGGGYSDSIMTMKIPVTIPSGSFAGAFFFNEATSELEALPIAEETSTSITVSTRHFSTSNLTSRSSGKGIHSAQEASYSDIIILAMDEAKLFALGNASSGFTPGIDDWEFTNNGSYIAAGGHCAGQSMTAMWYYYEQKAREGRGLYHALDPNPLTDYDNRLGYRFASTIQADFNFSSWIQHVSFQSWNPPLTFRTFLLAIHVTKQPQSVLMYTSKDTAGHAMVVYGVHVSDALNGTLEIADPNRPGKVSEINFVNGVLQPYVTGLRADGSPLSFDRIGMAGKSTYINWPQISARWDQVKAKTIGSVAPHAFPQVTLLYYDPDQNADRDMPSSFSLNADSLHWYIQVPQGMQAGCNYYAPDGTELPANSGVFPLTYGRNIIGFWIRALSPTTHNYEYVDFVWDTIYSSQLLIDPEEVNGATGTSYTWYASAGTLPTNARYEWDFGDGTAKVIKYNDGACSHTYATDGLFTITLMLYDNANNAKLGQATAKASIGGLWTLLHEQNAFQASLKTTLHYSDGTTAVPTINFPTYTALVGITWKDTTFSGTLLYRDYHAGNSYDSEICTIKGVMLADGLTIKSLTINWRYSRITYATAGNKLYDLEYTRSMTVSNAVGTQTDYSHPPKYLPSYYWTWEVDKMVKDYTDHWVETTYDANTGTPTVKTRDVTSVTWNDDITSDVLDVLFTKQ